MGEPHIHVDRHGALSDGADSLFPYRDRMSRQGGNGGEMLGHVAGHATGLGPLDSAALKLGVKVGTLGTSVMVSRAKAAGMKNVDEVLTAAVLNPEMARTLLLRPVAAAGRRC